MLPRGGDRFAPARGAPAHILGPRPPGRRNPPLILGTPQWKGSFSKYPVSWVSPRPRLARIPPRSSTPYKVPVRRQRPHSTPPRQTRWMSMSSTHLEDFRGGDDCAGTFRSARTFRSNYSWERGPSLVSSTLRFRLQVPEPRGPRQRNQIPSPRFFCRRALAMSERYYEDKISHRDGDRGSRKSGGQDRGQKQNMQLWARYSPEPERKRGQSIPPPERNQGNAPLR